MVPVVDAEDAFDEVIRDADPSVRRAVIDMMVNEYGNAWVSLEEFRDWADDSETVRDQDPF